MKPFLVSLLLHLPALFFAQHISYDRFANAEVEFVDLVDLENLNSQQYFVQTPYASSNFLNPGVFTAIGDVQITEVTLIYTDFQRAASFSQNGLNARRARNLFSSLPEIFQNPAIDFRLVGQTGCVDLESCDDLPHGFIISTRKDQESDNLDGRKFIDEVTGMRRLAIHTEVIAADGSKVPYLFDHDAYFPGGPVALSNHLQSTIRYPELAAERGLTAEVRVDFKINVDGEVFDTQAQGPSGFGFVDKVVGAVKELPLWSPALRKGHNTTSQQKISVLFQFGENGEPKVSVLIRDHGHPLANLEDMMDEYRTFVSDSVVLTALDRINDQQSAVVMDVTGSMAPYSSQLLLWLKLNKKERDFVVYNDGDNRADISKVDGETGGLYLAKDSGFEELGIVVQEAMLNGTGGDIPENAIEAIRAAQEEFRPTSIIWLADNHSIPRDLGLLPQVHLPVKVVVCGGLEGISTPLLDIARATSGSIHTIEQDIMSLASLKEGESISINGITYEIKRGKFEVTGY